ncbi:hypothetical protein FFWV33_04680 [Flavobacterium faecale]|uniref:GOLD domain-containing protein n=1 Tax=Flavobacterium faecale TaxID=1355330 RepID=A0A2S1LB24_9FLAO|nr:hypothetical protein [Flavobacterium faecale]AWG20888.1 hypothetical protein FFWV33_04680 [Flavobacterium faecale]
MKKILLLLVLVSSIISCTTDNGPTDTYTFHALPVDSYVLPTVLKLGKTDTIKLKYQKPTSCHIYQGIVYNKEDKTRTIAVQTAVKDNEVCTTEVPPLSDLSFTFLPTELGSYIFKFYKGKNTDGTNKFESVEIQVTE